MTLRELPDGSVEIESRWIPLEKRWKYCLLFSLFAAVGMTLLFQPPLTPSLAWVTPVFCWAVLTYASTAVSCNATTVRADNTKLEWRQGPLPWRPRHAASARNVEAILAGKVRRSKRLKADYGVGVRKRNGKRLGIVASIETLAQAESLAGMVASRLGVPVEREQVRDPEQVTTGGVLAVGVALLAAYLALVWVLNELAR